MNDKLFVIDGVQELTKTEIEKTKGGLFAYFVAYIAFEILFNPSAHANSFLDGFDDTYNY